MKSVLVSKTFWFNIITLLMALFALPEVTALVNPQQVIAVQSVINIILRVFFTSAPVALALPVKS